jgi:hypothetical protein
MATAESPVAEQSQEKSVLISPPRVLKASNSGLAAIAFSFSISPPDDQQVDPPCADKYQASSVICPSATALSQKELVSFINSLPAASRTRSVRAHRRAPREPSGGGLGALGVSSPAHCAGPLTSGLSPGSAHSDRGDREGA